MSLYSDIDWCHWNGSQRDPLVFRVEQRRTAANGGAYRQLHLGPYLSDGSMTCVKVMPTDRIGILNVDPLVDAIEVAAILPHHPSLVKPLRARHTPDAPIMDGVLPPDSLLAWSVYTAGPSLAAVIARRPPPVPLPTVAALIRQVTSAVIFAQLAATSATARNPETIVSRTFPFPQSIGWRLSTRTIVACGANVAAPAISEWQFPFLPSAFQPRPQDQAARPTWAPEVVRAIAVAAAGATGWTAAAVPADGEDRGSADWGADRRSDDDGGGTALNGTHLRPDASSLAAELHAAAATAPATAAVSEAHIHNDDDDHGGGDDVDGDGESMGSSPWALSVDFAARLLSLSQTVDDDSARRAARGSRRQQRPLRSLPKDPARPVLAASLISTAVPVVAAAGAHRAVVPSSTSANHPPSCSSASSEETDDASEDATSTSAVSGAQGSAAVNLAGPRERRRPRQADVVLAVDATAASWCVGTVIVEVTSGSLLPPPPRGACGAARHIAFGGALPDTLWASLAGGRAARLTPQDLLPYVSGAAAAAMGDTPGTSAAAAAAGVRTGGGPAAGAGQLSGSAECASVGPETLGCIYDPWSPQRSPADHTRTAESSVVSPPHTFCECNPIFSAAFAATARRSRDAAALAARCLAVSADARISLSEIAATPFVASSAAAGAAADAAGTLAGAQIARPSTAARSTRRRQALLRQHPHHPHHPHHPQRSCGNTNGKPSTAAASGAAAGQRRRGNTKPPSSSHRLRSRSAIGAAGVFGGRPSDATADAAAKSVDGPPPGVVPVPAALRLTDPPPRAPHWRTTAAGYVDPHGPPVSAASPLASSAAPLRLTSGGAGALTSPLRRRPAPVGRVSAVDPPLGSSAQPLATSAAAAGGGGRGLHHRGPSGVNVGSSGAFPRGTAGGVLRPAPSTAPVGGQATAPRGGRLPALRRTSPRARVARHPGQTEGEAQESPLRWPNAQNGAAGAPRAADEGGDGGDDGVLFTMRDHTHVDADGSDDDPTAVEMLLLVDASDADDSDSDDDSEDDGDDGGFGDDDDDL